MKKAIPVTLICMTVVGTPLAVVVIPPVNLIAILIGLVFFYSILLRIVKPIWIIAFVFICAPFIDVLRASYFRNIPFMGVFQELVLFVMVVSRIITPEENKKIWRFGLLDFLIVLYVIWNLAQVLQSPSILGGLYVWRWYSIGPLTYLVFRLYAFTKQDCAVIISSICIGLIAASIYIVYQYFILGPEKAAQFTQSLGFLALYRDGWRLQGSFGSPLVASASYSILVLLGMALLSSKRLFVVGLSMIVLGSLAVFITLSRSGVVIGLVGLIALLVVNFKNIKYKVILAIVGLFFIVQFIYLIPETKHFLSYLTNADIDAADMGRFKVFSSILVDAITRYPFGIGFGGGGAISQQAYLLFGGDGTNIPKYLGGDSVFLATLQTSGFLGFTLIVAIYFIFIRSAFRLLTYDLAVSQRILCLVSLGLFLGSFVTLGNLMDVWPLKLYLWSFGAIVMQLLASLSKTTVEPQPLSFPVNQKLSSAA